VGILDPNRAVEAKFLSYTAATRDGRQFAGMLAAETGNSITLVAQENKQQTILRTEIEELESSGKSLMPEGMEKDLPPQALADLLAFLNAQEPPRKTFAGNRPEIVRPYPLSGLRLMATQCEIYGPTLVFEEKYRNLGYWSSEADRAAWTVEVTQRGKYSVSLDYACADNTAGNTILLEAGSATLAAKVPGTGSWDNYRRLNLGTLELSAGQQRLVFRSSGAISGALLDLREVRLNLVDGQ
jgi:hypothetical protein